MDTKDIIRIVKTQTEKLNNLEFHKYWLDNFIVKNKEVGKDIMRGLKTKDLDSLYLKLR